MTGARLARFPVAHSSRVLRNPAKTGSTAVVADSGQTAGVLRSASATDLIGHAPATGSEPVVPAHGAIKGSPTARLVSPGNVSPLFSGARPACRM